MINISKDTHRMNQSTTQTSLSDTETTDCILRLMIKATCLKRTPAGRQLFQKYNQPQPMTT